VILSERWFCPNCENDRTGDDLTMACSCMTIPHRIERQKIRRAERNAARRYAEIDTVWKFLGGVYIP